MSATEQQVRTYEQLIDGQWVGADSGATFTRESPFDRRPVGVFPNSGEGEADRAVAAARRAFDETSWPTSRAKDKTRILRQTAELLMQRQQELGENLALESGKPIGVCTGEVVMAAEVLDYYAAKALDPKGKSVTAQRSDAIGMVLHEPVGVVGMITPWNYPLMILSWKVAPALAAGCTIVAKPSHFTPGSALLLGEILAEAGLPDGVYNVVTSDIDNGALVGQRLAGSEQVDKVAFTGSTATGKAVMRAAANNVKKVSLELGGKSPNIVFPDAPLEDAAVGAFFGVYLNSGQVCQAGSRLFVSRDRKDELVERITELGQTLRMGDPLDSETTLGPLISQQQLDKVEHYLEAGKREARLVTGGGRPGNGALAQGYFVEPTVFDDVSNDAAVAREEIFGPVLSVLSFDDIDDVIRQANDTVYGLAAAVWTRDLDTAFKVAKGLRAGTVWVNSFHSAGLYGLPYGGYKQSGIGRELGEEGLEEYLESKALSIKLSR